MNYKQHNFSAEIPSTLGHSLQEPGWNTEQHMVKQLSITGDGFIMYVDMRKHVPCLTLYRMSMPGGAVSEMKVDYVPVLDDDSLSQGSPLGKQSRASRVALNFEPEGQSLVMEPGSPRPPALPPSSPCTPENSRHGQYEHDVSNEKKLSHPSLADAPSESEASSSEIDMSEVPDEVIIPPRLVRDTRLDVGPETASECSSLTVAAPFNTDDEFSELFKSQFGTTAVLTSTGTMNVAGCRIFLKREGTGRLVLYAAKKGSRKNSVHPASVTRHDVITISPDIPQDIPKSPPKHILAQLNAVHGVLAAFQC
uniref:Uncharacterized protein n=1 Tax=viral metagenome TaxID=1070528 RepID=A0A2V0RNJ5_9ZZZZ